MIMLIKPSWNVVKLQCSGCVHTPYKSKTGMLFIISSNFVGEVNKGFFLQKH